MFKPNGFFVSCTERFKQNDRATAAKNSLHLKQPLIEFELSMFLVPDRKIAYTPTGAGKINGVILHRKLTVVGNVHLPVAESAGDQTLAADAQHLGGGVEGANGLCTRRQ